MSLRRIEILARPGYSADIKKIAEQCKVIDYFCSSEGSDERCLHVLFMGPVDRQKALDDLHGVLEQSESARIIITNVEATIPPETKKVETELKSTTTTREELYHNIAQGAEMSGNFLMLTFLSSVVAAIGLVKGNVAVLIGAMVIAPLLGPNLAFSLGAALGERQLMFQAAKTNTIGVGLSLILGVIAGLFLPAGLHGPELLIRTLVGVDDVALALASGVAAVLSLTSGLSSTLVGVMVAVALLPPAMTMGLMLGQGQWHPALGALILLTVNVVCVNLSAQVVFLFKGMKPRTWLQQQGARQSTMVNAIFWVLMLLLLLAVIVMKWGPSMGGRVMFDKNGTIHSCSPLSQSPLSQSPLSQSSFSPGGV